MRLQCTYAFRLRMHPVHHAKLSPRQYPDLKLCILGVIYLKISCFEVSLEACICSALAPLSGLDSKVPKYPSLFFKSTNRHRPPRLNMNELAY